MDLQQARQLEQLKNRAGINQKANNLTSQCWDVCQVQITAKLDAKTQNCLANCVERFIDTSKEIIRKATALKPGEAGGSVAGANEDLSDFKWN